MLASGSCSSLSCSSSIFRASPHYSSCDFTRFQSSLPSSSLETRPSLPPKACCKTMTRTLISLFGVACERFGARRLAERAGEQVAQSLQRMLLFWGNQGSVAQWRATGVATRRKELSR